MDYFTQNAQTNAKLVVLDGSIDDLATAVAALEADVTSLTAAVAALETDITTLEDDIEAQNAAPTIVDVEAMDVELTIAGGETPSMEREIPCRGADKIAIRVTKTGTSTDVACNIGGKIGDMDYFVVDGYTEVKLDTSTTNMIEIITDVVYDSIKVVLTNKDAVAEHTATIDMTVRIFGTVQNPGPG